jgi:DNA polymerase mu
MSIGKLSCVAGSLVNHTGPLMDCIQKEKAIVTPQWLLDSAQHGKPMPCGDYAALYDETAHHCQSGSESRNPSRIPPPSQAESGSPESSTTIKRTDSAALAEFDVSKLLRSHTSRYSCCRASPLTCPNQGLVAELDVIRRSRTLEGEERSALSYQRAIAVSPEERLKLGTVTNFP